MSQHAEFIRALTVAIGERRAAIAAQMLAGTGLKTIEDYREKVGEARALADVEAMIEDAAKAAELRSKQ